jgi:hypothetical protein
MTNHGQKIKSVWSFGYSINPNLNNFTRAACVSDVIDYLNLNSNNISGIELFPNSPIFMVEF